MGRLIAVNDRGRRIGDSHHRALLTNAEVDLLVAMHSQRLGYRRLSVIFEISRSQVRKIIKGACRAQRAAGWKLAKTEGET